MTCMLSGAWVVIPISPLSYFIPGSIAEYIANVQFRHTVKEVNWKELLLPNPLTSLCVFTTDLILGRERMTSHGGWHFIGDDKVHFHSNSPMYSYMVLFEVLILYMHLLGLITRYSKGPLGFKYKYQDWRVELLHFSLVTIEILEEATDHRDGKVQ